MHVDQFIDNYKTDNYASWFLFLKRLPAVFQMKFSDEINKYQLFCIYKDKKYRVTGASRMGDIWLINDFNRSTGYDIRVDIEECSNFTKN